jgi:hypothetical protein
MPKVQPFMKSFRKKKFFRWLPWVKQKYKIKYREYYRLIEDYEYYSRRYNVKLIVNAGYEFDGASAPNLAAVFGVRRGGVILGPAVIHDRGFELQGKWPSPEAVSFRKGSWKPGATLTFRETNQIFRDMLKSSGLGTVSIGMAYAAVESIVGRMAWRGQ